MSWDETDASNPNGRREACHLHGRQVRCWGRQRRWQEVAGLTEGVSTEWKRCGQHSAFDSTGAIKHTADELLHFKFTAGESTAEQSTWVY